MNIYELVNEVMFKVNTVKLINSPIQSNYITKNNNGDFEYCKSVYVLVDEYGKRDTNAGVYYGETTSGKIIVRPIGFPHLHPDKQVKTILVDNNINGAKQIVKAAYAYVFENIRYEMNNL